MLVDDMKRWRPNHLGDLGCEAQWFSLFYWVRLYFNGYKSNTVQLLFPSALNLSLMYHHWNQHFCQGYTGNHCHWKLYFYILKPDLQTFMSFSSFLAIFPLRSEYKLVAFFSGYRMRSKGTSLLGSTVPAEESIHSTGLIN